MEQKNNLLIQTNGITKIYENNEHMVTAISDINLRILAGDFIIIFGSSTSGKSTLFSILYGLEKPDIGEVFVKGESFYDFSETERKYLTMKKFGLIPQTKTWLKQISLLENVSLPLVLDGKTLKESNEMANERLKYFGLKGDFKKIPEKYSNYEQKLASLARATVNEPWIIFADEPYKGLTQEESMNLLDKIKNENKKGITVIISTTDPQYLHFATKWYFLNDGHLEDIRSEKNSLKKLKESIELVERNELLDKRSNEFNDNI